MSISASSMLNVNNCTCENNEAEQNGGAYYFSSCWNCQVGHSKFISNLAMYSGAALYIISSPSLTLKNNVFHSQRSLKGGGAVYWDSNSDMNEPVGLRLLNYFYNNTAIYGNNWATDTHSIYSPKNIKIQRFQKLIPSIIVSAHDYYGQRNVILSGQEVSVTLHSTVGCLPNYGSIQGDTIGLLTEGETEFNSISALCKPGGYSMIRYATGNVLNDTNLFFQPCLIGGRSICGS